MKNLFNIITSFAFICGSGTAFANSVQDNQDIYSQYCTGVAASTDSTSAQVSNPLVASAIKALQDATVLAEAQSGVQKQKRWADQLPNIQSQLTTIAKEPSVSPLVLKLLSDLDVNQKGFTASQLTMVNTIFDTLLTEAQNHLTAMDKVTQEFSPIDFNKLLKDTENFLKIYQTNVKGVDFQKLKAYATALIQPMNDAKNSLDGTVLLSALTIVKKGFEDQNSRDLDYVIDEVERGIQQLTANPNDFNDLDWTLQDAIYYLSDDFQQYNKNISYDQTTLDQTPILKSHASGLKADDTIAAITHLNQLIDDNADQNDIKYAASDVRYSVNSFSDSGNSSPLQTAIDNFNGEEARFSLNRIENEMKTAITQLSSNNSQTKLSGAHTLFYMEYKVKQSKVALGQALTDMYYLVLLPEANKANDENTKNEIASTYKLTIQNKAKDFFKNYHYNLESVSQKMKTAQPSVTAASQTAIDQLSQFAVNTKEVNQLAYTMDQVGSDNGGAHFSYDSDLLTKMGTGMNVSDAQLFVTQLCLDYRDRASMIPAKLQLITDMKVLEKSTTTASIDYSKDIWEQISADEYLPYQEFLMALQAAVTPDYDSPAPNPLVVGKYALGFRNGASSVCQTKFIFAAYVRQGFTFDNLENFKDAYDVAKAQCSQDDLNSYYLFNGATELKTTALESPIMRTKKKAMLEACETPTTMTQLYGSNGFQDASCVEYFSKPHTVRSNVARSALTTSVFYDNFYRDNMDSDETIRFTDHSKNDGTPFEAALGYEEVFMDRYEQKWLDLAQMDNPDMGFNDLLSLQDEPSDLQLEQAVERLRGSLRRSNSNWAGPAYTDGFNYHSDEGKGDPILKSSNSLSRADGKAHCAQDSAYCDYDGLRRWMYVTKVQMDNNYNPEDLLSGKPVNFETQWLDYDFFLSGAQYFSPSFSWGKAGYVEESEFDTLIYLINVDGERIFDGNDDDDYYH